MWWVSQTVWRLSGWRSTVRLGLPDFFGAYHHIVAPCDWRANWDRLNDAESYVAVKASFRIILPVHWDRDGCVMGDGRGVRVHHES